MKRRRKDTVDRLAKIVRRPGGEILDIGLRMGNLDKRYTRLKRERDRLLMECVRARKEAEAFRLKVCELEERIADVYDPWNGTHSGSVSADGPVRPERWFFEPAEMVEALTALAKANTEADKVVLRLSDGRYARMTGIRYESEVPGEPGFMDPSIVIEADI